jgi:hypothetical protein
MLFSSKEACSSAFIGTAVGRSRKQQLSPKLTKPRSFFGSLPPHFSEAEGGLQLSYRTITTRGRSGEETRSLIPKTFNGVKELFMFEIAKGCSWVSTHFVGINVDRNTIIQQLNHFNAEKSKLSIHQPCNVEHYRFSVSTNRTPHLRKGMLRSIFYRELGSFPGLLSSGEKANPIKQKW